MPQRPSKPSHTALDTPYTFDTPFGPITVEAATQREAKARCIELCELLETTYAELGHAFKAAKASFHAEFH